MIKSYNSVFYFTALVLGSIDNLPVNKIRHSVLAILLVWF